jgi:hypothetical protein
MMMAKGRGIIMSTFGLVAFRIFVLLLGIWTGSGLHDSLSNHFAWYADPVGWAARPVVEGMVNPWPFSTMLLLVATIVAAVIMRRYRGPGRREALIAIAGTALILVATLAWFVPQLGLMGGGTLSDAQQIAHAHRWIALNAVRQLLLIALFYEGLVALGMIVRRDAAAAESTESTLH